MFSRSYTRAAVAPRAVELAAADLARRAGAYRQPLFRCMPDPNLAGEVEPINSPAFGIFTKAGVTK
jgi:hypothetical protein